MPTQLCLNGARGRAALALGGLPRGWARGRSRGGTQVALGRLMDSTRLLKPAGPRLRSGREAGQVTRGSAVSGLSPWAVGTIAGTRDTPQKVSCGGKGEEGQESGRRPVRATGRLPGALGTDHGHGGFEGFCGGQGKSRGGQPSKPPALDTGSQGLRRGSPWPEGWAAPGAQRHPPPSPCPAWRLPCAA